MLVHKKPLKQMGCYLKDTSDKGLIMKPSEKLLMIDSFLDADFAEMYGHKAMDDHIYFSMSLLYEWLSKFDYIIFGAVLEFYQTTIFVQGLSKCPLLNVVVFISNVCK